MDWAQLGFQDATSPIMEELLFFHDFTLVILVFIIRMVGGVIIGRIFNLVINKTLLEGQMIECIWTIMPAIILIQIAVPSLTLLYIIDEAASVALTLRRVGHQWFWSYEYSDYFSQTGENLNFDSYIVSPTERLTRLLEVDNRIILPFKTHIRVLVSSSDVLHSWTVPRLGVKADACPGRLNQVEFISHRPGVLYGQCSEICGANHRFMPIVMELIRLEDFLLWTLLSSE